MKLPVIRSLIVFLVLAGCVKPAGEPEVSTEKKTYIVRSNLGESLQQSLTVQLYLTREDYYNNSNIVKTLVIPAGADSLEVELDSNTTYFYDAYTDDYSSSNWATWPVPTKSFKTDPRAVKYTISNPPNAHRAILLPDNRSESKWVAVGSFTKAGNTWDTMSAAERNKNIVLNRNQVAIYNDGEDTREFRFAVSVNTIAKGAYYIEFFDADALELIHPQYEKPYMKGAGPISPEYNALKSNSSNNNVQLPATDTFYLTGDAFKHTFIMVREK